MFSFSVFMEILGWVGILTVLMAYFLVSNKYVLGTSFWYQVLNLFGSASILTYVWYLHAWPNVALNVVWGLIAVVALLRIFNAQYTMRKEEMRG
jgi:hypothetical protein